MTLVKDIKIYFNMIFRYKPKTFWNELLSNSFDLKGVGHYRSQQRRKPENVTRKEKNHIRYNERAKCSDYKLNICFWKSGAAQVTGLSI